MRFENLTPHEVDSRGGLDDAVFEAVLSRIETGADGVNRYNEPIFQVKKGIIGEIHSSIKDKQPEASKLAVGKAVVGLVKSRVLEVNETEAGKYIGFGR